MKQGSDLSIIPHGFSESFKHGVHAFFTQGINIEAEEEIWREDGFAIVFEEKQRDSGRAAILALAHEYQQGAIFEYEKDERITLPTSGDVSQALTVRINKKSEVEVTNFIMSGGQKAINTFNRPWGELS